MSRHTLKLWIIAASLLAPQTIAARQRPNLDMWVTPEQLPSILAERLLRDRSAQVTLTGGTQRGGEIIRVEPGALTFRSTERKQPQESVIEYDRISVIRLRGESSKAWMSAGRRIGFATGLLLGGWGGVQAREEQVVVFGAILGSALGSIVGEAVGARHRKPFVIHIQH